MRERIETIVTVIVVTLLVWLYAEGRVVTQYEDQQITINFESVSGDSPIFYDGTGRITVSFRASPSIKREFDRLKEQPITLTIDDTQPDLRDERTIVLTEALANTELAEHGIIIEETKPRSAEIKVIRQRSVVLPLRLITDGFQLTSPAVIEPAEVELTLPEDLELPADTVATLRLDMEDIAGFEAGDELTQNVPIIIPEEARSAWTTITPNSARVTYTIRQTRDTVELNTVPVRVNLLVSLAGDFALSTPETERFIPRLLLVGPADALQQIRDNPNSVWVELRPTRDQLEAAADADPPTLEVTPFLVAPPGVSSQDGQLRTTTVTVTRKANASPR